MLLQRRACQRGKQRQFEEGFFLDCFLKICAAIKDEQRKIPTKKGKASERQKKAETKKQELGL